jgi:phosphate acetyltransferase
MPATLDAAALCKMAERGQIKGGILDGPLAFDNAISADAARIKGIKSAVAGDPDILLAPDLEAGNILAKNLSFLANADSAGITGRAADDPAADGVRSRIANCAVTRLLRTRAREKIIREDIASRGWTQLNAPSEEAIRSFLIRAITLIRASLIVRS